MNFIDYWTYTNINIIYEYYPRTYRNKMYFVRITGTLQHYNTYNNYVLASVDKDTRK